MTPADPVFAFLASEEAFELRREFAAPPGTSPPDPIRLGNALRRRLPADAARALAEQITLERRAHGKFSDPTGLLFERDALEQATSPGIARHHAQSIPDGASVLDLGCGIGTDSMAFAAGGHRVVAVDRNRERVTLASFNLRAALPGSGPAVAVVGDAAEPPAGADVLFLDPDRRTARGRAFRLADASPDADALERLRHGYAHTLVKAPPALPDAEIPPDAAVEFLSEGGECREALLRFGPDETAGAVRAIRVEDGALRLCGPDARAVPRRSADAPGAYLLDPDPALRRAGGVDALANELDAARVAPDSTYLFTDREPDSVWVRTYRVLTEQAFRARDLAKLLAEEPPGELIVKQRGVKIPEAELRRSLPTQPGGPVRILVLWADGPRRRVCLCAPVDPR